MTIFPDLFVARRLERAEGFACKEYAEAQRQVAPESDAEWMECAGAWAVFNGKDSPITQSFGLGLFEKLSAESLDKMEAFFFERGAPSDHEVSPFAGPEALSLLCQRGYQPIEISSVLYCSVSVPSPRDEAMRVRVVQPAEAQLWTDINARGWCHEHPELFNFVQSAGAISAMRAQTVCFLAEVGGETGAAGALCIHEGVALFGGAATVPELRRRGLQSALLEERTRYASEQGCDLAMMVAEIGSNSQRNAERQGFRVAYTRTKWRLPRPA